MKTLLVVAVFFVFAVPVQAQELPPPLATSPAIKPLSVEWIKGRISYYADLYGVSEITMNKIVACESNYSINATHITSKEHSVGLVQINLMAHNIDEYDARAPNFALDFLARKLSEGKGNLWTCYQLGTS